METPVDDLSKIIGLSSLEISRGRIIDLKTSHEAEEENM
jgi:hypothetical protein